ncbi:hypothetical protein Ocin01_16054 [Orchesella cincta]|uniref:Uncharacterized protein n=1 Tax=Orchesella cincta TaxID=48709 RepID=A0A1D2MCF7_ORCCI|nr:hypothetical protein Ocin01_16054 [Orchesella cincta]
MKEPSKIWNFENEKVFPFCCNLQGSPQHVGGSLLQIGEVRKGYQSKDERGREDFRNVMSKRTRLPSRQKRDEIDSDQDKIPNAQDETLGEIFTSDSESELEALSNEPKSSATLPRKKATLTSTAKQRRKRKKSSSSSFTSSSSDSDTPESEFSNKRKKQIAKPTPSRKSNPNLILHSCSLCRDNPGFSSKELFNKHLATTHKKQQVKSTPR